MPDRERISTERYADGETARDIVRGLSGDARVWLCAIAERSLIWPRMPMRRAHFQRTLDYFVGLGAIEQWVADNTPMITPRGRQLVGIMLGKERA